MPSSDNQEDSDESSRKLLRTVFSFAFAILLSYGKDDRTKVMIFKGGLGFREGE